MQTYRVNITGIYHVTIDVPASSSDKAEDVIAGNLDMAAILELIARYGIEQSDILSIAADASPLNN